MLRYLAFIVPVIIDAILAWLAIALLIARRPEKYRRDKEVLWIRLTNMEER